jgi:RNA polymerase sigma factor (sigma-70 family)
MRSAQPQHSHRANAAEARVSQLLAAHERSLMRVARHWSFSRDDALDAYQRALEIYVRRLDSLDPATELAWLKVVVKHEALAIRRQRSESVPVEDVDLDGRAAEAQRPVDDLLAGRERVNRSAEALRRLKPDEAQALMLKAQGLSYQEIGESLGWTYTKVNRCITEGRARFLKVYAEIEAGAECERFAPTLAALVGGTATADALVELRPHIRNCATCRATVRELHATRLGRLGALWPIPALLGSLRWVGARFGGAGEPDPAVTDPDHIPDVHEALRAMEPPDAATTVPPERFLDVKAQAYQWWHRLQGSDVAAGAQLAAGASGGGRVATIGAIVGLCLSSLGAGTVCVVTGVVDSPFRAKSERRVEVDHAPKHEPKRNVPPTPAVAKAVPSSTPGSIPERHSSAPQPVRQRLTEKSRQTGRTPREDKAAAREFDFEAATPEHAASARSATSPPLTAGFEHAIQDEAGSTADQSTRNSAAAEFGTE